MAMRLNLNLSTSSYQKRGIIYASFCILALGIVLFSGLNLKLYLSKRAELRKYELSIDQLEKRLAKRTNLSSNPGEWKAIKEKITFIKTIRKDNFSLLCFLNEMEFSLPKDLAIKRISYAQNDGRISIQGLSFFPGPITTLIRNLGKSNLLEEVNLLSQSVETQKEGSEPSVKFELCGKIKR